MKRFYLLLFILIILIIPFQANADPAIPRSVTCTTAGTTSAPKLLCVISDYGENAVYFYRNQQTTQYNTFIFWINETGKGFYYLIKVPKLDSSKGQFYYKYKDPNTGAIRTLSGPQNITISAPSSGGGGNQNKPIDDPGSGGGSTGGGNSGGGSGGSGGGSNDTVTKTWKSSTPTPYPTLPKFSTIFGGDKCSTYDCWIEKVWAWALLIIIPLSVLILTAAGILYMVSGGDPKRIDLAKRLIYGVLSGVGLIILARVILVNIIGVSGGFFK